MRQEEVWTWKEKELEDALVLKQLRETFFYLERQKGEIQQQDKVNYI